MASAVRRQMLNARSVSSAPPAVPPADALAPPPESGVVIRWAGAGSADLARNLLQDAPMQVPEAGGSQAAQALEGKGYQPAYKTYPMEHAVCLEEIQDIAAFLKQTLA